MSFPRILLIFTLLILCPVEVSRAQNPDSTKSRIPLSTQDVWGRLIPAGSAEELIPFIADPKSSGGDLIDIMTSDPSIEASLILPGGTEITIANAAVLGFEFHVITGERFVGSLIPLPFSGDGKHTLITLPPGSVPGTYQAKLNASATTSDAAALLTYFSSSTVRSGVATDIPSYTLGDTVLVTGLLFDGPAPLLGATITAFISDSAHPEVDAIQVAMEDSGTLDHATGDGLHTGTFIPDHTGEFTVAMRSTGVSTAGVMYSRVATSSFTVTAP